MSELLRRSKVRIGAILAAKQFVLRSRYHFCANLFRPNGAR